MPEPEDMRSPARANTRPNRDNLIKRLNNFKKSVSTGRENIPLCLVSADTGLAADLMIEFNDVMMSAGEATPLLAESLINYTLKRGKDRNPKAGKDHRLITSLGVLTSTQHSIIREQIMESIGPSRAPEQFAETKGMGQDLATLLPTTVINQRAGRPLYIGLVDIEAAYDTTWKEGVWFKLHSRGLRGKVWALLVSILSKYPTFIRCDKETSELIEILKGLPQGSSLSGLCFTAFLDDLAELLRKSGHRVHSMGITIAAIFFMDDLTLLAESEKKLTDMLNLLTKYGITWRLTFSVKSEVLVMGVDSPRQEWQLGSLTIKTVKAGKMRGVWFSDDAKPDKHIDARMLKAWATWHAAKKVGLVGGRMAYADQQLFTHQVIWATLDYGRQVAPTYGYGHRSLRNKLDAMQGSMGRSILGASRAAPTAGVLGENGWWPDSARHAWKLL